MRFLSGKMKDYPTVVNLIIIMFVVIQWLLTFLSRIPNLWNGLIGNRDASSLYVTMLSVAALQASFAGVIVVFGLSTQPKAFRQLRIKAGSELVNNWLSISYSGFTSAGFALLASILELLGLNSWSPWLFELSVLFCAHGIIRLLWLLKCLIRIVNEDDVHAAQKANEIQ